MTPLKQIVLIILDGWGYSENTQYNAIAKANPEYFNHLWADYPHALFDASGTSVGLLEGVIGTSEIGHLTIGAGKIIDTDIVRIYKEINNDTLGQNEVLQSLFNHVKQFDSTLHLMGLMSPGGVHSHQDHLFALIKAAKKNGLTKIAIHVFTDGRDVPPQSAQQYLTALENILEEQQVGTIATISGRYFAMDRDNNWDRVKKAEDALFKGIGTQYGGMSAHEIVEAEYAKDTNDEFISPCVLIKNGTTSTIQQNDGVLHFNFRPDRARELSMRISERVKTENLYFVTMTEYDKSIASHVMFPQQIINTTLSEQISKAGLKQIHIAETEKYAHVTYFLNGGSEAKHEGEEFVLIESRKDVRTHDLAPEMKAKEIADKAIEYINQDVPFIVINFANADMVGHTGKMEPTLIAIKTLDEQLERIVTLLEQRNSAAFITADHGNAELMFDDVSGQPQTAHTLNQVPGILTLKGIKIRQNGTLADIAPTILSLFGLEKPDEMTGNSLIIT